DLFDCRLRISAFAVVVFTSGQNEAPAEISDVTGETFHLLFAQATPGNVAEDDCIVGVQLLDGRRYRGRRYGIYSKAFVGKGRLQIACALTVAFNVQDLGASFDDDRRTKFIVVRERVVWRFHVSFERHRSRIVFNAYVECDAIESANQLQLPGSSRL